MGLRQRVEALQLVKPLLDGARERLTAAQQGPEMAVDAAIASVAGILHTKLVEEQAPPFIDFHERPLRPCGIL